MFADSSEQDAGWVVKPGSRILRGQVTGFSGGLGREFCGFLLRRSGFLTRKAARGGMGFADREQSWRLQAVRPHPVQLSVRYRYVCLPSGSDAIRNQLSRKDRAVIYAGKPKVCGSCALKVRCAVSKQRFVTRHLHEEALQRMNQRATVEAIRLRCPETRNIDLDQTLRSSFVTVCGVRLFR